MKTRIRPGYIEPLRNLSISFRELRFRLARARTVDTDRRSAVERRGAVIKTSDELRREIRQKNVRELHRFLWRKEKKRELLKEVDIGAIHRTIDKELIKVDLPFDEIFSLGHKGFRLEDDIDQLLDALIASTGGISALSRVIDAVYLIGRLAGEHPIKKRRRTRPAYEKRAEVNDHWVLAFNKAIRQAHESGLKANDAIHEARKRLRKDGVKIPVGDEALRWRERELRTGKKRK
jgi:hypothetical protein